MTQKELLYCEDAVGHEDSIIKILSFVVENLDDENLISFINDELDKHTAMKEKLMNLLEVSCE